MPGGRPICDKTIRGLVFSVELLSGGMFLMTLKFALRDRSPSLIGADGRAGHEFKDRLLSADTSKSLDMSSQVFEPQISSSSRFRVPDGSTA